MDKKTEIRSINTELKTDLAFMNREEKTKLLCEWIAESTQTIGGIEEILDILGEQNTLKLLEIIIEYRIKLSNK